MFRWLLMVSTDNKPELTVRSSGGETITIIGILILLFIAFFIIGAIMYENIKSINYKISNLEKKIEEISSTDKINEKSDE